MTTALVLNEQSGMVACTAHAGHYAQSAITANPEWSHWDTPLGTWSRVTLSDEAAWIAAVGCKPSCEVC